MSQSVYAAERAAAKLAEQQVEVRATHVVSMWTRPGPINGPVTIQTCEEWEVPRDDRGPTRTILTSQRIMLPASE